jgi:hypothetical protein
MTTADALDQLRSRILAGYSLQFLKTWEEARWEAEFEQLSAETDRNLVLWSATAGASPALEGEPGDSRDPLEFLRQVEMYPDGCLFLVRDFHPYLRDPRVVRCLRELAASLAGHNKALLMVGPVNDVPVELQKDAVSLELPLPGMEELRGELAAVLEELRAAGGANLDISEAEEERLLKAVIGLTAREVRKALMLSLQGRETVDDDVFTTLVSEKRHLFQSSDLLEFHDLEEGIQDIGGLDVLKDWLARRAEAFSERAREQGIPMPRGVLLLGVQGCGKSLSARVAARLLSFPLVRLDVSNLLSSDRGGTERNLRDVLRLMETIAPAVLWLDEIDKGFAGAADDTFRDATIARLVGSLLTWMESRKAPVFVVATANAIAGLPPEMLRRGRFDELFFVDLPNYHERKQILEIHLARRGWKPEKFDLRELANQTEGFSGAELEQIVVSGMVDAYGEGQVLSQAKLIRAREQTVPLSVTMEERIFALREWAATRCRRATSDSRVTRMLDEERRQEVVSSGEHPVAAAKAPETWENLAEHGQLNAAIVEYLRKHDIALFPKIQEDFTGYLTTSGDQGLALRSDLNVVLWTGMSRELAELLAELIAARRIYVHTAGAEAYKTLGRTLKLPAIAQVPDEKSPRPSWLPSALRLLPPPEGSGRFGRVTRIRLARA